MAGAEEVFAALPANGTTWAALVLNRKGLDRAVAAGAEEIHVAYPVTETFARRNQNMGLEEAADGRGGDHRRRPRGRPSRHRHAGRLLRLPVRGQGRPGRGRRPRRAGWRAADELMLADTIGVGVPGQVKRCCTRVDVDIPVGLHLHNTRNTGYANAYAGLEQGVTLFDASVGGLGGCPFAPRATGNIATEDLLYLLEGEGVDTGVDLDGVIGVAEWLSGVLGRPLPGLVHRADRF